MAAFSSLLLLAWTASRSSVVVRAACRCSAAIGCSSGPLDEAEERLVSWLSSQAVGQSALFDDWEDASVDNHGKRRLLAQLAAMDDAYPEEPQGAAGLAAYFSRARALLAESAAGENPYAGCTVEVPAGDTLEAATADFLADEARGLAALPQAAFVLVAGGLGERLGHDGLKVELPVETLSGASFLQTCAAGTEPHPPTRREGP